MSGSRGHCPPQGRGTACIPHIKPLSLSLKGGQGRPCPYKAPFFPTLGEVVTVIRHRLRQRPLLTYFALPHRVIVPSRLPLASRVLSWLKAMLVTLSVCPLSAAICFRFLTSHRVTILSAPAEASTLPSALKATVSTAEEPPVSVPMATPVFTFHSCIEPSETPTANWLLSALKAAEVGAAASFGRVCCKSAFLALSSSTVPSPLVTASRWLSGLKTRANTPPVIDGLSVACTSS